MCPDSARLTLEFALSFGFACDIYFWFMGFAVALFLLHSSRQTSPEELLQLDAVTLVHDFLAQSQFQVLTSSVVVLNGNDRNYPPATLYPPPIYYLLSTHHPHKIRSSLIGFHYNKWATGVRRMRAQKPIWSHIKLHSKPGSLLSISC